MSDEEMIDLLDKLDTESAELEEKINNLGKFIESAEYKALDMDHRVVLGTQLMAMCSHLSCLNHRILLLTPKEGEQDEQPEPSDGC